MADEQESEARVAPFSALVLLLTGVALTGCVALAVGVTVRLVDLPRPRVSADLSAVSDASTGDPARGDSAEAGSAGTDSTGAGASLALVGNAASSATNLANEQAAKLAARRERAREASARASRSRAREVGSTNAADETDDADESDDTSRRPGGTGYGYPHRHYWHPDAPQYPDR